VAVYFYRASQSTTTQQTPYIFKNGGPGNLDIPGANGGGLQRFVQNTSTSSTTITPSSGTIDGTSTYTLPPSTVICITDIDAGDWTVIPIY
jgi:hypothetical protein